MTDKTKSPIPNPKLRDSSSKLIFSDNILSSQFLRDYADLEILRYIQPEDIEDVSERYVPLYSTERESDTVKKVNISRYLSHEAGYTDDDTANNNPLNLPLYVVSLVEHKTKVEYNVIMQMLRYMVYIGEDYEKEMNKSYPNISNKKDFKYPPILPIVYFKKNMVPYFVVLPKPPLRISLTSSSTVMPYSKKIPCINPMPAPTSRTFPSLESLVILAIICPSLSE